MPATQNPGANGALIVRVQAAVAAAGGWLPFDRFMALALYEPGLGYYASGRRVFGTMPASGSDFVTAPEISPLFGQALARQVAQALAAAQADEIWEFGAGSGALAAQVLGALNAAGVKLRRYSIIEVSGTLRQRQAERLAPFAPRVHWLDALPPVLHGVALGNEVLDAMPVQRLLWDGQQWLERGVALAAQPGMLAWADRPTDLRPPRAEGFAAGTLVEIHPQAEAFVRTLASCLQRGAAFFIDYGFPEAEYYHPQRSGGTLACHRAHRAEFGDDDVLQDVGDKDITAHVNFSGIALAAQDAGLDVLGYTSQGRFLLNCGLAELLQGADVRSASAAHRLVAEHEMGELFKVIGLARGVSFYAIGFAAGDRSHRL